MVPVNIPGQGNGQRYGATDRQQKCKCTWEHKLGETDETDWSREKEGREMEENQKKERRENNSYLLHFRHLFILSPPSFFSTLHTHTETERSAGHLRPCRRALVRRTTKNKNVILKTRAKAECTVFDLHDHLKRKSELMLTEQKKDVTTKSISMSSGVLFQEW